LTARTTSAECGGIALLDQHVSLRMDVDGVAPEACTTVIAPVGHGEFQINGQLFDGGGLCLLKSRAELHSINNQIQRVLAINVPDRLLQETGRATIETWESHTRNEMTLIDRDTHLVGQLRSLILSTLCQPINKSFEAERAAAIACSLAAIIAGRTASPGRAPGTPKTEAWRIIRRARSYIDAHLGESIRMSAICTYSATSLSKLERIFRRELQMSPSQYVLARRLGAVNRELAASRSKIWRISDIALKYGFGHLGRFSGTYYQYFGELPSQTLRLS
jgi:AraC-like DNA-binding protein